VQTYTLAIADGVLFACLPDEADISAAITDATATNYGFGLSLDIVRGATLTDAAGPEDEVVWQGRRYRHAVRCPFGDRRAEPLTRARPAMLGSARPGGRLWRAGLCSRTRSGRRRPGQAVPRAE